VVDPAGALVVVGSTSSTDLPVVNAIQPARTGASGNDLLLARIALAADTDGDGMLDAWERQMGLSVGVDDAGADDDHDGLSNVAEEQGGTHPRGFHTAYLAEGATGAFFDTRLAIVNPDPSSTARVWIRFQDAKGRETGHPLLVPPLARRTVDVASVVGLQAAEFGTIVESDLDVAVSRTMQWDASAYGAHAGQAVAPSPRWYFAEGATIAGFQLFYLVSNPHDRAADVHVRWLVSDGRAPLEDHYTVAAHSRYTIWVNHVPGLAAAQLGATFATDETTPVIVERSMYLDSGGQVFGAGHAAAGVTAPATEWFVAEGATGSFFDLFLLLINPGTTDALVDVRYLRPSGAPIVKRHVVRAGSRHTIWVDLEDPALASTAVATEVTSANGVPVVMERVMWWPGPTASTWYEAHAATATRETGTMWVVPDGWLRGGHDAATYLLLANPGAAAAVADVTLLFEDGSRARGTFTVPAGGRVNVNVGDEAWTFESAADEARFAAGGAFGAVVESTGAEVPLVVESAVYWNAPGRDGVTRMWAAGTSTGAVKVR
jgi:hypothetical protein